MIKNFDRDNLRAVIADLNAAVAKIAKDHGMVLSIGPTSFTSESATIKLHADLLSSGAARGEDVKAQDDYQRLAVMYGCKPEWLGKSFISPTRVEFTVIGLKRSSIKYPILVTRNSDGKKFKFTTEAVRKGFES